MLSKNNIWHSTQAFPARLLQHTLQGGVCVWGGGGWITNHSDGISGGIVSALDTASGSQTWLLLDVRTSALSTSPGAAAEQEGATSMICGTIIRSRELIAPRSRWFGRKAAACYCAGQIRRNKSPVLSRPGAPRRMQQSCSSMTCHKHEGKHTLSNTLRFYCLWEFTQQQLMAFHFPLYRAIKWRVSSLPGYFSYIWGSFCSFNLWVLVFVL